MKKIIFILLFIIGILTPVYSYAAVLYEIPPQIEIIGINEEDYKITKTVKQDVIVIELQEKTTNIKYSWSFDKKNIKDKISINVNIDFETSKKEKIDSLAGDSNKVYLSFSHHGALPQNTKIRVDVSKKFKEKDILNLYYYNEEKQQIEFIEKNITVKEGYTEFEIEHCSEYFLASAIVNDNANNPQSLNFVVITLVFVVIALMTYTMFKK